MTTLPIHFAPLQGHTDLIYRNVHARLFPGIDAYYTPFIRYDKGEIRKKDLRDTDPENDQTGCLVPQLIASSFKEADILTNSLIERGYNRIDINMGCPFPMLVKRNKGCGILRYPDKVTEVMKVVCNYPQVRFSVKIRLGWENSSETINLLPLFNETPLEHITLHARLGTQQYKGKTDMKSFSLFAKECRHKLIYNGDLTSVEDIHRIRETFPQLGGIMIGRGLLANPALASQYVGNTEDSFTIIKQFHDELFETYAATLQGNTQLLSKMKTLWEYLLPDANRKWRKRITKSTYPEQYREAVQQFFSSPI